MTLSKKWYHYFIVTDDPEPAKAGSASTPSKRVADVVPEAKADLQTGLPGGALPADALPADLSAVYEAAKIAPPPHGYSVLKVAEMLESEHIR